MANYYDALIAAYNNVTQPPPGVSGAALTAGMTLAQRLAAINGWTVTGTIPATMFVTGDQVFNCIVWSEFNALTDSQQRNVLQVCATPGMLMGGSASVSHLLPGMLIAYFTPGSQTIQALTALAKASVQSWCQANGYPFNGAAGALNGNDLVGARLATLTTSAPSAPGSQTLTFTSVPSWVVNGLEVHDISADGTDVQVGSTVTGTTATTVTVSKPFTGTGIAQGDVIGFV